MINVKHINNKENCLNALSRLSLLVFVLLCVVACKDVSAEEQHNKFDALLATLSLDSAPIPPQPPEFKNKWKNFNKVQSCLIRNVFYEGPRYHAKLEQRKKYKHLSKEDLLLHINAERVKVINVTMNRVRSERYPDDVCKVVYQYKQFSWTLEQYKVDNSLYALFKNNKQELENIKEITRIVNYEMLHGFRDTTQGALYYHTHDVDPYWRSSKEFQLASMWHKYYGE